MFSQVAFFVCLELFTNVFLRAKQCVFLDR